MVRDALKRLREQGLIVSRRGSGSSAQKRLPLDIKSADVAGKQREMLDNLEFRNAIEPQAAALAAERRLEPELDVAQEALDRHARVVLEGGTAAYLEYRFHLAVAKALHNRRFVDAIQVVEQDISYGVNLSRFLSRFTHLERSRERACRSHTHS